MASKWLMGSSHNPASVLCLLLVVDGLLTVRPGLARTASGSWTTVAPMPTPRWSLGAATGSDGKIFAIGGWSSTGASRTVEAYDPSTDAWSCSVGDTSPGCSSTSIAPMPTPRANLAVAAGPDGKIYAIGGLSGLIPVNTVEAYNLSTNTWSSLAPMPTARDSLAAATGPDGRIYAIGGRTGTNGSTIVSTVEAYNPSTNSWSEGPPMPTSRGALAAVTGPDGRVYAIGGDGQCGFSTTVEAYNPSTSNWSAVASMATERYALAAAVGPDGRIYAIGGCCRGGVPFDTVEAYDASTNTWSTVAPMPTGREAPAAATGPGGRIYAIGGLITDTGTILNTVEAYGPAVSRTATPATVPRATTTNTPTPTPLPSPSRTATPIATPRIVVTPAVSVVPGPSGAATASFTVSFSSTRPGQGEVYFGSGPGCVGLVEIATHDLHPGTTQHTVVVTGNDLLGTVGDNGIIPGVTYWFEVVTVTRSAVEVDTNNGQCYSVTVPTR